jgi:hypothetical protein
MESALDQFFRIRKELIWKKIVAGAIEPGRDGTPIRPGSSGLVPGKQLK